MLLLYTLLVSVNVDAATRKSSYSIVLSAAPGTNLVWTHKEHPSFVGRTIFVQQMTIKGAPWERLCVGFFDSRDEVISVQKKIRKIYPGAWITKISRKSNKTVIKPASKRRLPPKKVTKKTPKRVTSNLPEKKLDSLMQRAKTDYKNKKYSSSIRYLNALVAKGGHKYSMEALELLGQARQRKGQRSHAINAYEKYLKLYPDSEGAIRVKQRLAGILTATSSPREKLKMSAADIDTLAPTFNGSFSQYYRNNRLTSSDSGSVTSLSQLWSFLDVTSTARTSNFDYRLQFTGDHTADFTDNGSDDFRFIESYLEVNYRKTGSSAKIGRQSLPISNILKRFDGISAGYQVTPDFRLNFIAGAPVESDNKSSINSHKSLYGFTFETGTFLKHWDMNLFYFKQESDNIDDRNSIGTEVRYSAKSLSVFGMIDYDLLYNEVNVLQVNANLFLKNGRMLYVNTLLRKTPALSSSNALIGLPEQSLEELSKKLNIEQIYQLARDRTPDSQTISIGGNQPINEQFQVTADITILHIDSTKATQPSVPIPAGVSGTREIGPDYYLSAQLVATNLLKRRDTSLLGVRFYQTEPSTTLSLIANTRFPLRKNWRLNPRLQIDFRSLVDGRKQTKIRAMVKTDYRYNNSVRFDLEAGYGNSTVTGSDVDLSDSNLYLSLGYRWNF